MRKAIKTDARYYIFMELCNGSDLKEVMELKGRRLLPLQLVVYLLGQLESLARPAARRRAHGRLRGEERVERLLIRLLRRREAAAVHAVVDSWVDPLVDRGHLLLRQGAGVGVVGFGRVALPARAAGSEREGELARRRLVPHSLFWKANGRLPKPLNARQILGALSTRLLAATTHLRSLETAG